MPTENVRKTVQVPGRPGVYYLTELVEREWGHSPRVNGKLVLRSNSYTKKTVRNTHFILQGTSKYFLAPRNWGSDPYISASKAAHAAAYARFRGKIYSGGAALGITLATAGQSRDMVLRRVKTLQTESSTLLSDVLRSKSKGRDASGLILETFFGWIPLYSDIHASASTVIQKAVPPVYVRGSSTQQWSKEIQAESSPFLETSIWQGSVTRTFAGTVAVTNPNLWLQERAGLLNYAAVAWDLVPWSFMVNAFSTTGAIINSLTDYAGLSFGGFTDTIKTTETFDYKSSYQPRGDWDKTTGFASHGWVTKTQSRSLIGGPPGPPLVTRVPELNFSTAAIGLSLVVQNFSKLRPLYTLGKMSVSSLRKRVG